MPSIQTLLRDLETPEVGQKLSALYGNVPERIGAMQQRWLRLAWEFEREFPTTVEAELFSTPGRTEVGGNHTDHNAGRVLAAAVDLDLIAVAGRTEDSIIRVISEGYPRVEVDVRQLEAVEEERYSTAALIRGICARLSQLGWRVGGFNACITSDVPKGSGLSSSAAFEVQIVTILNYLYNQGQVDPVQNALISQFAENNYFGKPCGLMDQTTCAVGGFVTIDFQDAAKPIVHKLEYDFAASGYSMVIVETGGDHADLTDEYAGITSEMKSVAHMLGGKVLRDVSKQVLLDRLPVLHGKVSDRAILRAFHFFDDDQRVVEQVDALEWGDFPGFLNLVRESGRSSWMLLQNCFSTRSPLQQGITLAQALTAQILGDQGAWRVHGGGFAGTIQVFVPAGLTKTYVQRMESVFGVGSCYPVMIRNLGSTRVDIQ